MLNNPKISVVIVTWNAKDLITKCLLSIDRQADAPYELFVIDNGSTDDTANFLRNYKPQNNHCVKFEYILNNKDCGLSVAANKGFKKAQGEYILLLNPDTEMAPQTLSGLSSLAAKYPKMGAMGVKMLNPDNSIQHCVSRFPSLFGIVAGRLKFQKIFPKNNFIKKRLGEKFDYAKEGPVESVKGALFFISARAMKEIGFFDEEFFLWFEETDYCRRLVNAGYEIIYTPDITVIHQGGASIAAMPFWEKQFIYNSSLQRYFKKHHGLLKSCLAGFLDPLCTATSMIVFKK